MTSQLTTDECRQVSEASRRPECCRLQRSDELFRHFGRDQFLACSHTLKNRDQIIQLNGFCQIAIHSSGQAALSVSAHRVSGERDDWNMAPRRVLLLSNLLRGFKPVHAGHFTVHQNQVKRFFAAPLERVAAALSDSGLMASLFEESQDQPLVHGVVLRDENVQWRSLFSDRVSCNRTRKILWTFVCVKNAYEHFAKLQAVKRLAQVTSNPQFFASDAISPLSSRGEYYNPNVIERAVLPKSFYQAKAVHLWHVRIGQDTAFRQGCRSLCPER
jgi:hypothetical protein